MNDSALEHAAKVDPLRAFPIALAHVMANRKPGDALWPCLGRLFNALPFADKTRCRAEMQRCLEAKRGESPAHIVTQVDKTQH